MCPRLPTPAPSSPTICRCTGKKVSFGRAGLAIPRSTLAQWVGQTGVQLQPLVDALRGA
ncbi:IS66 family transposase [Pseudomonas fluorescens]|uniref:IS66 family transposase n=1 Tax=Pseudomonas fluorescens TaxID=294 RepID=UPI0012431056